MTVDDVNSIGENKKIMEEKIIDNGLLMKASKNAEKPISDFLESNNTINNDYEIKIQTTN